MYSVKPMFCGLQFQVLTICQHLFHVFFIKGTPSVLHNNCLYYAVQAGPNGTTVKGLLLLSAQNS